MTTIEKRRHCISCGSRLPDDIVRIGHQYPSAVFFKEEDPLLSEFPSSPLDLTRCENPDCTLVQLSCEYDLQPVFDHYPYESGSTATMKEKLASVLKEGMEMVSLTPDDVVLDIGGNDGTLLKLVNDDVKALVNIDPAANVCPEEHSDNYLHVHGEFSAERYQALNLPPPKLITAVAMFYQLSDPVSFCEDVRNIMSDDSVWVLQMTYLGSMLEDNILDNIVHEHVGYYSLHSLESLLGRIGLYIAEARVVESYGGSLRVLIVKNPDLIPHEKLRKTYPEVVEYEKSSGTNNFEVLYAFNSRAQLLKKSIRAIFDHLKQINGEVWGFGASTKGNMLLQFLGIDHTEMPCILDNSRKKIGRLTTGTLIPIIDETTGLRDCPDYLMILPYYYTDAFRKIIAKQLPEGRTVHLFIPLPHPRFESVTSI